MIVHFRQLTKHIFVYGLGDTINKLLALFIVPLFTHYLSPADYGVSGILIVTNTLIIGLSDLGFTNGIVRFFKEEKEPARSHLFSTASLIMVGITTAIALAVFFYPGYFSQLFFKSSSFSYIMMINFFTIPLTLATSAPMIRWRLEEKSKLFAIFNVGKVMTGLGLNILFIVVLKRGLVGLFESSLINAAIYALVANFYVIYKKHSFRFSKTLLKKLLIFGLPFVFSSVSIWIINWADRFILLRLTNLTETGLYVLGYTMGMAIMLPVGAFGTAWVPFYMSVSDKPEAKKIYSLTATYYCLVVGIFVLLIATYAHDYFYFFTPERFHSAYLIVPIITLAYALKGLFSITMVGTFLAKKTIYTFIAEAVAMVINIGLMLFLIPHMGRMGAAWGTLAAYAVLPFLMIVLGHRFYPIKYEYVRLVKLLIVGLLIYFVCEKIYAPNILNILLRGGVISTYPVILYLIGFFKDNESEYIMQYFKKSLKYFGR